MRYAAQAHSASWIDVAISIFGIAIVAGIYALLWVVNPFLAGMSGVLLLVVWSKVDDDLQRTQDSRIAATILFVTLTFVTGASAYGLYFVAMQDYENSFIKIRNVVYTASGHPYYYWFLIASCLCFSAVAAACAVLFAALTVWLGMRGGSWRSSGLTKAVGMGSSRQKSE